LGSHKSLACVLLDGDADPLIIKPHPELPTYQAPWLPSVVCLTERGPIVGEPARQLYGDPSRRHHIITCVKRDMGLETKRYSLGRPGDQEYSPAEISGFVLAHLRNAAASQLGRPVTDFVEAVVTVPAYFGQVERKSTVQAGELAGFERVHLLDEPIAAATSLLGGRLSATPRLIMLVDLGRDTLDVTLLLAGTTVSHGGIYELARDGDRLGGIDWDRAIALFALRFSHPQWRERIGDIEFVHPANLPLWDPCETAKKQLSSGERDELVLCYGDYLDNQFRRVSLTRADFLRITQYLSDKCIKVCNRLVETVPPQELARLVRKRRTWKDYFRSRRVRQLTWSDIDDVYLLGGGSRVPSIRDGIRQCWKGEPRLDDKAELRVGYGAALCAAQLSENPHLLKDSYLRCPHAIGVRTYPSPQPRRTWLAALLAGKGAADREKAKEPAFDCLIAKNQRIPDTIVRRYQLAGDADTFVVELVEEHRDLDKPPGEQLRYEDFGRLEISGLPQAVSAEDRFVKLEFHYHSDRDMRLYATVRGIRREYSLERRKADRDPPLVESSVVGEYSLTSVQDHRVTEDRTRPCTTPYGDEPPISGPQQDTSRPSFASPDEIHCTAFAPPSVARGETFLLQVFAHLPDAAGRASTLARDFDPSTGCRGSASLVAQVLEGQLLSFDLILVGGAADTARESLRWRGRTQSVQFLVTAGTADSLSAVLGRVTVSLDTVPIGQIGFKIALATGADRLRPEPLGTFDRFRLFFISYAAKDRPEVVKRVQMLPRLGKEFRQDLLSLDPGDRWEKKLYELIRECDATLLFWSSNAKASEWVLKECLYCIDVKGIDRLLPVIIELPPPLPPPELAELHMNDKLLYFIEPR
jgi:molecular chaperone DnaK (HSP70)